jgi:hypothetical protein
MSHTGTYAYVKVGTNHTCFYENLCILEAVAAVKLLKYALSHFHEGNCRRQFGVSFSKNVTFSFVQTYIYAASTFVSTLLYDFHKLSKVTVINIF